MSGRASIWLNEHFALEGTGFHAGSSPLEGDAFGTTGAVDVAFLYRFYWEFDGFQSDEIMQHDVVLRAGLTFHLR
jgi:hypothetical protein